MRLAVHPRTFAALVAAALAFGAAQALAAPARAAAPADVCSRRECNDYCAARGARGSCVGDMCVCSIPAE